MNRIVACLGFSNLLMGMVMTACSSGKPEVVIHPRFKDVLGLISQKSDFLKQGERVIWQHANRYLVVRGYRNDSLKFNYMVMVSYRTGGSLEERLGVHGDQIDESAADGTTLLVWQPPHSERGYALVGLENPGALHGLAAAAHLESHPVCGALELVSLSMTKVATKFTGPYYSELLSLPEITQSFGDSSLPALESTIKSLEKLGTRFHTSSVGVTVPQIVADDLKSVGGNLPGFKVELQTITVADTPQKSVVATIPGQTEDDLTVVLGAHLDSINSSGPTLAAPGADDDASGIATINEILRVIAKNNFKFHRRVEIHAYGAEEVGLFGSASLAQNYAKNGRKIVGMMQFDMNAWSQNPGQKIYLVKNDTSDSLRKGTRDLLHTYFSGDFEEASLSAGTSDHKSWTAAGYPAVFPFENPVAYNRTLHTIQDSSTQINNLKLTERMTHLGLGFLAHYAGLTASEQSAKTQTSKLRQSLSSDLKIAIKALDQPDLYSLSVASSKDLVSIEVCPVSIPGGLGCSDDRSVLTLSKTSGDRQFFGSSTPLLIKAGQSFALFGMTQNGKTVYLRKVQFLPK